MTPGFFALGLGLNLILAVGARVAGKLTNGAAFTGFVLGTIIWAGGGAPLWMALGAFFLGSLIVERFHRVFRGRSREAEAVHKKTGRRDAVQVAANVLFPAAAAGLSVFLPHPVLIVAALGGIAAATADTWAGELGVMSSRSPVSIVSFRELPPGMSGGVTLLGTFGSVLGGVFIVLVYEVVAALTGAVGFGLRGGLIVVGISFASALADSVLGASIQERFLDSEGKPTERPVASDGTKHELFGGVRGFTNDVVNLLCSALAVGATALIW